MFWSSSTWAINLAFSSCSSGLISGSKPATRSLWVFTNTFTTKQRKLLELTIRTTASVCESRWDRIHAASSAQCVRYVTAVIQNFFFGNNYYAFKIFITVTEFNQSKQSTGITNFFYVARLYNLKGQKFNDISLCSEIVKRFTRNCTICWSTKEGTQSFR